MRTSELSEPRIELHGWDARGQVWHGPDELTYNLDQSRHILRKLRQLPGSWYGRLRALTPGQMPLGFYAAIHDLGDAGLAILDLEGSPGGPMEATLVVPSQRRARVREEFAFEFVSFLRFQEGLAASGSELAIHDYIQLVLTETPKTTGLVFSVETQPIEPELRIPISHQVERLAMSMIGWMAEKDASSPGVSGCCCSQPPKAL